ncbi:hypothetical protein AALD74_20335 [Lachnospiraceae bacterium 48-21]
MAIAGKYIHSFQYMDYKLENAPITITDFLTKEIKAVESKHVANYKDSTKIFFEFSEKVGYPNTVLGFHRNASIQNEYFRIQNMSHSICNRAVRFVISKDGRMWSDNTHWTLAYLLQKGTKTLVSDIPAYIVDFREIVPTIYDKNGVVFDSIYDIKSSIASAKRIQERLDLGWRPTDFSYTIKQLHYDIISVIGGQD